MARRLSISLVLAALVVALVPSIASGDITGSCEGEAELNGVTYTPEANDTPGTAIPIPDRDGVSVRYSAAVGFENKNFSGSASVVVGPFNITLGQTWSGANEQDVREITDAVYELDDFRDKLPIWIPGVWKVTASHEAGGNSCSGFAMIKLEGSPLGTAVGWIVLVALLALLYATIGAITQRRVATAGFSALLFGGFLALALMMLAIRPLENVTVIVIPVVLAILAMVAASVMGHRATGFDR